MMFLEFFQHRSQYIDIDLESFCIVHTFTQNYINETFFITYNYLCKLNFLEKEIAVIPVHLVLRSRSVGLE